tara:strand:+ start:66 stop:548 length:483 start_codon:yes stop_codon:yes gene_type:complete
MATEKLKFKLMLHATMWNKPPHVEIKLNDKSFYSGDITGTEDKPDVIEFEHELNEGGTYSLDIHRSGKGRNETVINEKGDILNDQLLHIKSIEIDEIDIGGLVYEGVYEPTYAEPWATQQKEAGVVLPKTSKNVTSMGHNGVWRFKFQSPFYMWLLENLY